MTDTTNRAQCPVCHHSIRLTAEGTIAVHDTRVSMIGNPTRCTGSGRRPQTP